jgi:hypothetical protein
MMGWAQTTVVDPGGWPVFNIQTTQVESALVCRCIVVVVVYSYSPEQITRSCNVGLEMEKGREKNTHTHIGYFDKTLSNAASAAEDMGSDDGDDEDRG